MTHAHADHFHLTIVDYIVAALIIATSSMTRHEVLAFPHCQVASAWSSVANFAKLWIAIASLLLSSPVAGPELLRAHGNCFSGRHRKVAPLQHTSACPCVKSYLVSRLSLVCRDTAVIAIHQSVGLRATLPSHL